MAAADWPSQTLVKNYRHFSVVEIPIKHSSLYIKVQWRLVRFIKMIKMIQNLKLPEVAEEEIACLLYTSDAADE